MNLDELLNVTGGKLIGNHKKVKIKKFEIDSRKLQKGDCFIALKGKKYDGHEFINNNIKASVVISEKNIVLKNIPVIKVNSTYEVLELLIKYYRGKYGIPLIAITGSNGKTTLKELISSILESKYKVLKNIGNNNNIIGVFKTVKELDNKYDVIVLEVGMNHEGEIKRISDLIKPNCAIITNIGSAHIGNLGSKKNIFKAKMEIISSLKGLLIVNGDGKYLNKTKSYKCGINYNNDLIAYNINIYKEYMMFNIFIDKEYEVRFNNPVKEYIPMILESIKVGIDFNISMDKILDKIANYESYDKRLRIIKKDNYTIIDDSYNASYESVRCGLVYLSRIESNKIIILGDMLELGAFSKMYHKKINHLLKKVSKYKILTVGNYTKYIYSNHFKCNNDLINYLKEIDLRGNYIYVKGSNSMHLDEIVNFLNNK